MGYFGTALQGYSQYMRLPQSSMRTTNPTPLLCQGPQNPPAWQSGQLARYTRQGPLAPNGPLVPFPTPWD